MLPTGSVNTGLTRPAAKTRSVTADLRFS